MKIISLTQGQFTTVDDATYEWASKFRWSAERRRNTFYATRNIRLPDGRRTTQYLHREIMKADEGVEVDHRDGDGGNNLPENLRTCSHAENARNRPKTCLNASGHKGVSFKRDVGKWRAQIGVGGRVSKFLGCFDTVEQASAAYKAAAEKHHGEFTRKEKASAVSDQ